MHNIPSRVVAWLSWVSHRLLIHTSRWFTCVCVRTENASTDSAFRIPRLILQIAVCTSIVACVDLGSAQTLLIGRLYASDGVTGKPRTKVTLTNPLISFSPRDEFTDKYGNYVFQNVVPASGYEIKATDGDKFIAGRLGIEILVGESKLLLPPLIEGIYESGNVLEDIKQTQVPELNLSPSDSENISGEQLKLLPRFNRTFLALGLLSPSTHDLPAGSPLTGATFSISGSRPTSNNFLLDGTDNVASSSNQAIPFQVSDSIQEFRVIYSVATAEYGRGQGGVVEVITSRAKHAVGNGSAEANGRWHGSSFTFYSNNALNAKSPLSIYSNSGFQQALLRAGSNQKPDPVFFADLSGNSFIASSPSSYNSLVTILPSSGCMACGHPFDAMGILNADDSHVQPLKQSQFGFSVGGPVAKKIWLFGSYEGTIIDNPNQVFERVPSAFDKTYLDTNDAAMLMGNQSAQFAQKILSLYPHSNVIGVPGVLEFFKGQAPNFTHAHDLLFRSDYTSSDRTRYLFRYDAQILDQLHDASLPSTGTYAGNGADRKAQNENMTASQVYSVGQHLNDLRLGFTQFRLAEKPQDSHFDATAIGLPTTVLPTIVLAGIDPRTTGATPQSPGILGGWFDSFWNRSNCGSSCSVAIPSLDGLFPFARIGAPLTAPSERRDSQVGVVDSFFEHLGRHQLKLGAEYHYLQNIVSDGGTARGLVISNNIGEFTHDSETCISCGVAFRNPSFDYALRQPAVYTGDLRSWTSSVFVQDTFNIRPNLALSLGVRYDFLRTPKEAHNQLWNFDPTANGLVRQSDTKVFDPFNFQCLQPLQTATLDSVYSAAKPVNLWRCAPSGSSMPGQKYTDFAPRIGLAYWSESGQFLIRGGAGIFYDQTPVNTWAQLIQNRPSPLNLGNPSAIYGQNFFSNVPLCPNQQCGLGNVSLNPAKAAPDIFGEFQAASGSPAIYSLDQRDASTPFTLQFNGSLQRQLGRHFVGQIGYIGTLSYKQPVLHNINFQDEFFCTSSGQPAAPNCDNLSYFPVFMLSNVGSAIYNALVVKVQGQSWHGMRVNGRYTFSRSNDNASSGQFPQVVSTLWNQLFGFQLNGLGSPFASGLNKNGFANFNGISLSDSFLGFPIPDNPAVNSALITTGARPVFTSPYLIPQDPINFLRDDYGRSDFDTPHRVVVDFTYEPTFPRQPSLLRGWIISSVIIAESGQPFTVFAGPAFGEVTQRANLSGPVLITGNPSSYFGATKFSLVGASLQTCPGVYVNPGSGQIFGGQAGLPCTGNTGRNAFYGPMYTSTDMALQKKVSLFAESKILSLRFEVFNLFNHSNFYNPVGALSTDGFTPNPAFGHILSVHDARQIQIGARLDF